MQTKKFEELKAKKQGVFMAHVYFGDPDEDFSIELIKTLAQNGVDIIEFGVPFSDPTADGSTFINACTRAIKNGMTPKKCIEGIRKIREIGFKTSIVVTSYFNIVYQYGIEKFMRDIKEAGAQGLIIPEAVIEESDELQLYGDRHGINIIYLIGPYSTDERIKKIITKASCFLYLAAVAGVTGARENLNSSALELIKRVRKYTELPLFVGFGISKPEHAKMLIKNGADGVIIGSAIGKIYERYIANDDILDKCGCLNEAAEFAKQISQATIIEGV